jgi:hypothetical protein
MNGEEEEVYWLLVGKTEGMRPLGIPRYRWLDNLKMDLVGIGSVVLTGFVLLRIGTS